MKKRVFSIMDRMFNFIPEKSIGNGRYVVCFNSGKEPIILIDTEDNDITFSTIHMNTVMGILGIHERDLVHSHYGREFNNYVLEWSKQRFGGYYTIYDLSLIHI